MIRNIFSVFLIFVAIAMFAGCGPRAYIKELSKELSTHIEILQEDQPVIEGVQIFNTDIIIRLYEKDEKLLSARWESWENVDQLIFAIRNSYREGLHGEFFSNYSSRAYREQDLSHPRAENNARPRSGSPLPC